MDDHRVDEQHVEKQTQQHHQGVEAQGTEQAQYLADIVPRDGRDGSRDEREDSDGGDDHDQVHHLDRNIAEPLDQRLDGPGMLVGDQHQANAEEEREEDHLQHADVLAEREHDVLGHDLHQGLERATLADFLDGVRAFGDLMDVRGLEVGADLRREGRAGLKHVDHHESDGDGENRGQEIDRDGSPAHARELADIGEGCDAGDQRSEDQRHGDEFQQIDEEGAERGDPVPGEFAQPARRGYDPERDSQREADHDLPMEFQLHSFSPFPWVLVRRGWAEAYAGLEKFSVSRSVPVLGCIRGTGSQISSGRYAT